MAVLSQICTCLMKSGFWRSALAFRPLFKKTQIFFIKMFYISKFFYIIRKCKVFFKTK